MPTVGGDTDSWGDELNTLFDDDIEEHVWITVSKSSNYTASIYEFVLVDASGGNVTITLPSPGDDVIVGVKKTDSSSNTVTIATPGSETIDGSSSISTSDQYATRIITSDGSNFQQWDPIIEAEIDHDSLSNFVSNEHIDHSNVDITAGDGLTGGGDITSSRTLNAQNVTSQSSNYTASEVDIVLADASGGSITITLPSPSTDIDITVKKTDSSSNAVDIATPGSETIDGSSSLSITSQYTSRTITSDGSNYFIV